MNLVLLISGLVQLILSLLLGIIFIYAAFKIFLRVVLRINNVKLFEQDNVAISILVSAIIFAVILVIKNAAEPAGSVFSMMLRDPDTGIVRILESTLIILLHVVISGSLAFLSIFIALKFFTWLTSDIDEMEQVRKNNVSVSILIAAIIISVALLVQSGIREILDSVVPFPPISINEIG